MGPSLCFAGVSDRAATEGQQQKLARCRFQWAKERLRLGRQRDGSNGLCHWSGRWVGGQQRFNSSRHRSRQVIKGSRELESIQKRSGPMWIIKRRPRRTTKMGVGVIRNDQLGCTKSCSILIVNALIKGEQIQ